jgi:hypothetical protein
VPDLAIDSAMRIESRVIYSFEASACLGACAKTAM